MGRYEKFRKYDNFENLELYEKVKVLKKGNATKRQGQLIAIFAKMESSVNGMTIVIQ